MASEPSKHDEIKASTASCISDESHKVSVERCIQQGDVLLIRPDIFDFTLPIKSSDPRFNLKEFKTSDGSVHVSFGCWQATEETECLVVTCDPTTMLLYVPSLHKLVSTKSGLRRKDYKFAEKTDVEIFENLGLRALDLQQAFKEFREHFYGIRKVRTSCCHEKWQLCGFVWILLTTNTVLLRELVQVFVPFHDSKDAPGRMMPSVVTSLGFFPVGYLEKTTLPQAPAGLVSLSRQTLSTPFTKPDSIYVMCGGALGFLKPEKETFDTLIDKNLLNIWTPGSRTSLEGELSHLLKAIRFAVTSLAWTNEQATCISVNSVKTRTASNCFLVMESEDEIDRIMYGSTE